MTPEEDDAFSALERAEMARLDGVFDRAKAASAEGGTTPGAEAHRPLTSDDPVADWEKNLRPVPIRREHADELFVQWQQFRDRQMKEWIDRGSPATPDELRAMLVDSFFDLLDRGEIIALTHQEHYALSEEIGTLVFDVLQGGREASPELKAALAKLAFSFGRQYGLTEYDMGMEPITDARG